MADDSGGINARMAVSLTADIQSLIRELRKAGDATDSTLTRMEQRSKAGASRMKNSFEQIKLEMDLDQARAHGNNKVVEKLTEELALRRQITRLTAAGVKEEEARALATAHVHALGRANANKEGVSGALGSMFGSTRMAVLEEGSAKLGIYGGALEKLGGAGMVAAAGLAAVGISLEEAHKAMEFAEEVANTARKLHITTDALQEYRFAMKEVGGTEQGANEALEAFSAQVGKAQAGLPKAIRAFKELGFTKAEIDNFKTVEEALDAVTEKIGGLGKNVQKDAVIDQLGLTGMKPLIEAGAEKMKELREEAQKLGVVMDADLVKRGDEMAKKFDVMQKVISVQLKQAFVDLGPVLLGLTGMIAGMATGISDMLNTLRAFENRSTHSLQDRRKDIQTELDIMTAAEKRGMAESHPAMQAKRDEIARIDRLLHEREEKAKADTPKPGAGENLKPVTIGGEKHNGTREASAAVQQMLDGANKDRLAALAALTGGILEHAAAERSAIDAELKGKLDRLTAENDKIKTDKTILAAKKRELNNQLMVAAASEVAAADAKKKKIDTEATIALVAKELAIRSAVSGFDNQVLQDTINDAKTSAERRRLELQLLNERKALWDAEHKAKVDAERLKNPPKDGEIVISADPVQMAADRAHASAVAAVMKKTESPWQKWASDAEEAAKNTHDALESYAVKGMDDFNNGLADAIVNGKDLGDSMKSILRGMEADLIRYLAKQAEIGLFGGADGKGGLLSSALAFLPHFADGTSSAPGGLAIVGERGPELVSLSRGAQVIPNYQLMHSFGGSPPRVSSGGATSINVHSTYDLTGAVTSQEVRSMIVQSHQAAVSKAVDIARRGAPAAANSDYLLNR